jgi:hypothetical protein
MAKLTLDWCDDELFNFLLIGIASHSKDYKLCYNINKYLNFDFCRTTNDYSITIKEENFSFPMYEYIDDENLLEFYLFANKSKNGYLIKEFKNIDYLFMIKGNIDIVEVNEYIDKLKEVNGVLTAFPINIDELKSKEHLIF